MKATLQGSKEGEWRGGTSGVYGWEAYSARNKGILLEKQHLQGQLFGAGFTHNTSSAAWKSEPFSFCGSLCTSTTSWATLSIFYKVYFIGRSQDTSSPRTHRACWWIGCSSPPPGEWLGRNPAQRGIAGRAGRTWSEEEKKKKNKKWERFDSAHQDHNFLSYLVQSSSPRPDCVNWNSSWTLTLQYQQEILWVLPISRKHFLAHWVPKSNRLSPRPGPQSLAL